MTAGRRPRGAAGGLARKPDSPGHDSPGQGPRRLTALAVAALAAAAMTGCSALSGSASGSDPQSITLYSGQHPQTTQKLVAAFEKQTGIKVSVRSDDEDVLAPRS